MKFALWLTISNLCFFVVLPNGHTFFRAPNDPSWGKIPISCRKMRILIPKWSWLKCKESRLICWLQNTTIQSPRHLTNSSDVFTNLEFRIYEFFQRIQVSLCQRLFFLQNMGRTRCVQKNFWMLETISVPKIFSPGLSLEFSCIELVIPWTICRHIVG